MTVVLNSKFVRNNTLLLGRHADIISQPLSEVFLKYLILRKIVAGFLIYLNVVWSLTVQNSDCPGGLCVMQRAQGEQKLCFVKSMMCW